MTQISGQEVGGKDKEALQQQGKQQENKAAEGDKPADDKDALQAKEEERNNKQAEQKPPASGNLSLPASQQPGPLFGFGGNIIDAGEVQLFLFSDEIVGKKRKILEVIPSALFGITDTFSVFFNFPFAPLNRMGCSNTGGIQDFFVQLEYAFYNKTTHLYEDQATLLANLTVPTGSFKKNPPTGLGSPSLFLGGTYFRTYIDWFLFTEQGAVLTSSEHGSKAGDQFLYQFGCGRNIPTPSCPGYIYAWMVEVDGQYGKKNRIYGSIDPDSGGNVILLTPSLWISNKNFLLQFGVSLPIYQNLFGNQKGVDYLLNFNIAWSFF